ncbi:Eukaryotic aspartyl protease-like protein 3 [Elsinoe fawcettii]|nr:Eukaryotic aspartyl protease-like protein 3 [Elsinoe fawcettii]
MPPYKFERPKYELLAFIILLALIAAMSPCEQALLSGKPLAASSIRKRQIDNGAARPIQYPPSQYWEGNDGAWSTFALQVGTPPQVVRILPSTSETSVWVVDERGCNASLPSQCPDQRGALFASNFSTTWQPLSSTMAGSGSILTNQVNISGNYGYDAMTLGWQGSGGPTDDRAEIISYDDTRYFIGMLGLKPSSQTKGTVISDASSGFIRRLKDRGLIPSVSYAYTAGNIYRQNGVLASLTLGGYDTNRFVPNKVSFSIRRDTTRDLLVNVQQISLQLDGKEVRSFSTSFTADIDSTSPFMILPSEVCILLDKTYGLTTSDSQEYYRINVSRSEDLMRQNASVTFHLGPEISGGSRVSVALPYAAFNQNISYPHTEVGNTERYFPVRCTDDASQYILGRTFLQEAYLIADYDSATFKVAQCRWDLQGTSNPQIEAIKSTAKGSVPTDIPVPTAQRGFNLGATSGMIISGLVVLLAIGLGIWFVRRRRRQYEQAERFLREEKTSLLPRATDSSFEGRMQAPSLVAQRGLTGNADDDVRDRGIESDSPQLRPAC